MKQFAFAIVAAIILVASQLVYGQTPTPTPAPTETPTPTPSSLYIELIAPNGGETLVVGQTYRIEWVSSPDIDTVSIMLLQEGGDWIVTSLSSNPGYYDWVVDKKGFPGNAFMMEILGHDTGVDSRLDYSNNVFRISPAPAPTPTPIEPPCAAVGWTTYD